MSYIIIPSNFDWTSIPSTYENSTLEIRDIFDLNGLGTIELPKNVTLVFNQAGLFSNGIIDFDDSKISTHTENITCFDNCTFQGSLLQDYIHVNWFGAKTGVQKIEVNTTDNSAIITSTNYNFSQEDLNNKIQILNATEVAGNAFYSTQFSITQIINQNTVVLSSNAENTQNNTIALIGKDSGNLIENVMTVAGKVKEVRFHGNYLIGKWDGNLVPNQNPSLSYPQRLLLDNDDITYDYTGATIYGLVFLANKDVNKIVKNTIVKNLEIYCLGDSLDASEGNSNWNGIGVLAGDNNTFENIIIRMNGGVRALSIQSSDQNTENEITNTTLNNISIIGEVQGNQSDGIDISTNNGMINNVNVNNVTAINVASILIARNVNEQFKIKNINCSNIQGKDIHKVSFRYSFVDGGNINNVKVRRTGTPDNSPFLIQSSDNIIVNDIDIYNDSPSIVNMVTLTDNGPLTINNLSIVNSQIFINGSGDPAITNNAIFLGSDELNISNIYIENFENAFWKFGRSALIQDVVLKNVSQILRDNTPDEKLRLENVMELKGTEIPAENNTFSSVYKAQALACFSGLNSPITPLASSRNIESIVKDAVGTYTITFTNEIPNYPGIISGQGRFYGGTGKFIAYRDYPIVATGKKKIKVICQNPNGTLGDSDLITVIVF